MIRYTCVFNVLNVSMCINDNYNDNDNDNADNNNTYWFNKNMLESDWFSIWLLQHQNCPI